MQSTQNDQNVVQVNIGKTYIEYCRRRLLNEYLPRIEQCIAQLTDDDVWWRAYETNNSVGNLLLHLTGNIRQWIVAGFGKATDGRNRPIEFSERKIIPKRVLLDQLKNTLQEANVVLGQFDERKLLDTRRIQKYDVTYLDALSHVIEHFAQHVGQIIYITKLRTGKDLNFYNL